jgi:hypothetical protein
MSGQSLNLGGLDAHISEASDSLVEWTLTKKTGRKTFRRRSNPDNSKGGRKKPEHLPFNFSTVPSFIKARRPIPESVSANCAFQEGNTSRHHAITR